MHLMECPENSDPLYSFSIFAVIHDLSLVTFWMHTCHFTLLQVERLIWVSWGETEDVSRGAYDSEGIHTLLLRRYT